MIVLRNRSAYSGTSRNPFFKYETAVFNGEQENVCIVCVRVGYKSLFLAITVCHHSASLVMPNGDPRDGFFYLILTLMIIYNY